MVASIEYIEGVISTYARAAEVNRKTPARQGQTVVLTPDLGREVMVTGDLHGHRRNLTLIRHTAALDRRPERHLVLQEVCHGGPTYPTNGGCMSHTLLEDMAKLTAQFPGRVHFLLGNHELAELTDYPIQKNRQLLNLKFRLGLQEMYGAAVEKVREASFEFLKTCPLAVRVAGGAFITHSLPDAIDTRGFDPGIFSRRFDPVEYYEQSSVFDLLWGRDYRAENAARFAQLVGARVLINGHEPCPEGYSTPNPLQVILDSCCDKASYVILPVGEELTRDAIVRRIRRL
jgi:hypothetical protein